MRRVGKSTHLWICLALLAVLIVSTNVVPNWILLLISNCLMLVGSAAVALVYTPVAWRAVKLEQTPRVQHIAIGICLVAGFNALWRITSLLWILSGGDPALTNNDVVVVFQCGIFLGYAFHLTSPGAVANLGPLHGSKRVWIMAATVAVALLLALVLAYAPPDVSGFVKIIKPYIPR